MMGENEGRALVQGASEVGQAVVVRRRNRRVTVVVIVVALVVVLYLLNPLRPITRTADLDPALLAQGTTRTMSTNGQYLDGDIIIHAGRGEKWFWNSSAIVSVHSEVKNVGFQEEVPLGGSLTCDGLGTVYLVGFSNDNGNQDVTILWIPEE
ncbi:MAG: hypothetical protein LBV00_02120 [Propionibacteriaceae bacterium]|jgi:hypothetical protein|nr:hypothetical protein [Propionibacteriaceae bacterium]